MSETGRWQSSLDLGGAAPRWTAEDRIAVAALAGLPHMTIPRLRALLTGRRPVDAVPIASGVTSGHGFIGRVRRDEPEVARRWAEALQPVRLELVAANLQRFGVEVLGPADDAWPEAFTVDPAPPVALFVVGSIDSLRRRVAVVGTRNPTEAGRQIAARFGHELSAAGLSVVSGLALGIDGAAHRGALAAPDARPIAVVANGHDDPYPRRHAALWRRVETEGAVVSEWPPGTRPDAFRFPLRNRIVAALAEVVVVIESRERGGSLITAREAADRGVEVMAVPGDPSARTSLGTNLLVQDGAGLALEPADVLDLLGLDHSRAAGIIDQRPLPDQRARSLLARLDGAPATVDSLAADTGRPLSELVVDLARLERDGWLFESDGWFQALDSWARIARGA